MIKVNDIILDSKTFPDGTPLLLDMPLIENECVVRWCYEPGEEFSFFAVAMHYRQQAQKLVLEIPYMPNARMDRIQNDNECFTLKWFCEIVNMIDADEVYVSDPHSPASLSLLKNSFEMGYGGSHNGKSIQDVLDAICEEQGCNENAFYCFPDKGAKDKYSQTLSGFDVVYGEKKRDWNNGHITSLDIVNETNRDLRGATAFLVDDICSYGGTIVRCAAALKELGVGKVVVFVSHCENAMLLGKISNDANVDEFYTTDDIFTGVYDNEKIHVFNFWRE